MSGRKSVEKIRKNLDARVMAIEENLDPKNGCLWCYRPRMPGSLYCCEEHQHLYEWHNGKPKEIDKEER